MMSASSTHSADKLALLSVALSFAAPVHSTMQNFVQTNYLGPYLLTRLLQPSLPPGARVINVSSITHRVGHIHDPARFFTRRNTGPTDVYPVSVHCSTVMLPGMSRLPDCAQPEHGQDLCHALCPCTVEYCSALVLSPCESSLEAEQERWRPELICSIAASSAGQAVLLAYECRV